MSAETITVLVTRPAPFWLPAKFEETPDPKTNIRKPICAKLLLIPGTNKVRRDRWELTEDHPTIQAHIKAGTLNLDPTDEEVVEHTNAPTASDGLAGMTIAKAAPWIAGSESTPQLSTWRRMEQKRDGRQGILDLIDRRLSELSGGTDE